MNTNNEQIYLLNAASTYGTGCKDEQVSRTELLRHIKNLRSLGWEIREYNEIPGYTSYLGTLGQHTFTAYIKEIAKEVAA